MFLWTGRMIIYRYSTSYTLPQNIAEAEAGEILSTFYFNEQDTGSLNEVAMVDGLGNMDGIYYGCEANKERTN